MRHEPEPEATDAAKHQEVPLPCVVHLLQEAWDRSTTATNRLCDPLCLSPCSVDTYFSRALALLEVHDRAGAVIEAVKRGWVHTPPPQRRVTPPCHGLGRRRGSLRHGTRETIETIKMSVTADRKQRFRLSY